MAALLEHPMVRNVNKLTGKRPGYTTVLWCRGCHFTNPGPLSQTTKGGRTLEGCLHECLRLVQEQQASNPDCVAAAKEAAAAVRPTRACPAN